MKRSKSLLMLIPLLIGGMQTAKSEVIVPVLSEFTMAGDGSSVSSDLLSAFLPLTHSQ